MSVLVGDFNLCEEDRDNLREELRKYFHLKLENYPAEQITISGSNTDLTISRYIHFICKSYVSYVLYKISL